MAILSRSGREDRTAAASLPSYALFGNSPEAGFLTSFHVERVSSRHALHDGIVEPHRHPHLHQLTFWLAGTGTYFLEGTRRPVVPGMFCWVPAGRIHGFSVDSGSDAIVISMAREHVDAGLAAIERRRGEQVLLQQCIIAPEPVEGDELARLFSAAERNYAMSGWGYQESIGAIASQIFIYVGRWLAGQGALETGEMLKTPLFDKLQACVEKRFAEHPSVEDLAAELGATPYLLNKACRSAAGINVSAYVRRRILREVERLLLFTVADMAEITELTGFSDPSHFTRSFKACHGETPTAWRTKTIAAR